MTKNDGNDFFITLKTKGWKSTKNKVTCGDCRTDFDLVNFICHQVKCHQEKFIFNCTNCHIFLKDLKSIATHSESHEINNFVISESFKFVENLEEVKAEVKIEEFDDDTPLNFLKKKCPEVKFTELESDFVNFDSDISDIDEKIIKQNRRTKKRKVKKKTENFRCKKCEISFSNEQKLKIHGLNCELNCPECELKFDNFSNLKQHYNLHNKKLLKCKICPFFSDKNKIEIHYKVEHQNKIWECDFCRKYFYSRLEICKHMSKHLLKQKDEILCTFCGNIFKNNVTYKRHVLTHTSENMHPCEKCDSQFLVPSDLKLHYRTKHEEKKLRKSCDICNLQFRTAKQLKSHYEKVHPGTLTLKCPTCEETFFQHGFLRAHQEKYQGTCQCVCEICQKKFARENFKRHVLSHQKGFQCSMCPRKFTQKAALKYHINLHTGNRPYNCSKCDRSFHSWLARKTHEDKHDKLLSKKTQERNYPCPECKNLFKSRYELGQHLLDLHGIDIYAEGSSGAIGREFEKPKISPSTGMYECNQCDYKSAKIVNFYAHRYVHKKDRPRHECEICGKSFLMRENLKAHVNQHAGMKYPCTACGKPFSTKKNLWQHSHKYCAAMRRFFDNK